ncbi:ephrin-A3-like protein [Lates japonicus]|uniref:Ephrin-A3-like protein n=1 Tax=Lates japonicus TaxID=270547 RepID=A0AAD3R8V4_LATJO|nr:ephrin-A3-like protein [Lates japonicus]
MLPHSAHFCPSQNAGRQPAPCAYAPIKFSDHTHPPLRPQLLETEGSCSSVPPVSLVDHLLLHRSSPPLSGSLMPARCPYISQADDDSSQTSPDYTVRPNIKIHNLDEFNPEVPKLEKSVSGSSPSRDRLLLTVAMLLVSAVLLS